MPARASGLRTGVLFCLLSFDAKTSFTVVVVVKDKLLGLLCRIFTKILSRFAVLGVLNTFLVAARSIEFSLGFGKHWIPETIFLKYTKLT